MKPAQKIDENIKEAFFGIELKSQTDQNELRHAICYMTVLKKKKPVRIVQPKKNSRMALQNSTLVYENSASRSELRKCGQNTEEVENMYYVSRET